MVLLHGLGADAEDLFGIAQRLRARLGAHLEFVLPRAPARPVTLAGGATLNAWFDIYDLAGSRGEDAVGIDAAAALVGEEVAALAARGVPPGRTAIGGFSQGGALALHYGCRASPPPAAVFSLSGYVPLAARFAAEARRPQAPADLPVFMSHGRRDDVISIDGMRALVETVRAGGFAVEWREYDSEHRISEQNCADLGDFLARVPGLAGG